MLRLGDFAMSRSLFHLAFPIHDIEATIRFYVDNLGCTVGRRSKQAVTLGLAGHQLVAHVVPDESSKQKGIYPRHFGLTFLSQEDWQALADRAKAKGLTFYQQPRVRFPGTRIEHRTFFLEDPSHNLLEFKHYTYESAIFGEQDFTEVGDTSHESTD
jgi:extradiol dioxygenase family protein